MDKHILITITIVASISSILANEGNDCKWNRYKEFQVCNGVLTAVRPRRSHLELDVREFSSIAPNAFQGVEISRLELLGDRKGPRCTPKIFELQLEGFETLSKITDLELDCLEFPVGHNPFRSFKELQRLVLERIDFKKLSAEFFTDFPKLNHLGLYYSNITTISEDTLSKIPEKLSTLVILSGFREIKLKAFRRFTNLQRLHVTHGNLASISADMFDGLHQLRTLDLQGNSIEELAPATFQGLPNLVRLVLSDNKIDKLTAGVFDNLHNLEELSLISNGISIIPTQIFEGSSKLRFFNVQFNRIREIEPTAFSGLRLAKLDMTGNPMKIIAKNKFVGLQDARIIFSKE
ncbi:leucine-rich repeat-containing protein 15-like [Diachasmimorpha longicaudata]|uniref:leucine-rich repeat-containing protein 15-like n=1 Tax=Diachasmimorpha longicaudata TaxID=58733 RepID=UPI0030B90A27